jgi:4-aminobutyrate aminotransferase-like enzyme
VSTSSNRLADRLRRVESRNITYVSGKLPIFWESGHGAWIQDVDGRRYLDLTSAFAVMNLGHHSPAVYRALLKQARKLWHGMGDVHPAAVKVELLEALRDWAPGDLSVSILSSSGAEAVESALKTARLATGKPGVIAFSGAYHGLSYGTLAATDRREFQRPFADQLGSWVVHTPYPDSLRGKTETACLEAVENLLKSPPPSGPAGAILVEPIQGRGGIRIPGPSFLSGLRGLATRYKVLLIADEIFTGFCRTGRDFAVEHAGVVPDLLCAGKALANGYPLSACIGTPQVMQAWPESDGEAIHTSTFLGNPLGCAMALASLEELRAKRLSQRAAELGAFWKTELHQVLGEHPRVGEIRGLGLMLGIELVKDRQSMTPDPLLAGRVIEGCLERGLLLLSGGIHRNVLTLTPPLVITRKELSRATKILREVLHDRELGAAPLALPAQRAGGFRTAGAGAVRLPV